MAQPTLSDLHVNRPLTDMSVLMIQDKTEFISDQVFKNIASEKRSDLYFKYDEADFNRVEVKLRGDAAPSAGAGWDVSTDSFLCDVFALHHDVSDQRRGNTDLPLDEDKDAVTFLTHQGLLKRETDWASTFFTTGVWTGAADTLNANLSGTDATPAVKFDNASGVPIKVFKELLIANKKITGYRCNTLVMGEEVWNAIQESADFLDRIKGGATKDNPAIVMTSLLAAILGIDRVLIGGAIKNTAAEGAAASNSFVFGESCLLCYVPPSPGKQVAAAGYTFTWKQYGAFDNGMRIKKFRMEENASDRVEMEFAYDMKVVMPAMGVFITDCLT